MTVVKRMQSGGIFEDKIGYCRAVVAGGFMTFGGNPPAATMISCALIDPKYKIEIEVTALAPDA